MIVGSGPAGSALANRLSEDGRYSILLLEAGRPESLPNFIPAFAAFLGSTDYNWDYVLEKTPGACLGKFPQNNVYSELNGLFEKQYILHLCIFVA